MSHPIYTKSAAQMRALESSLKIVLAEKVSPATLAILQKEPGWNCITADKITDLPAELADADALIVRSAVQANAKLLAAAPKLRIIGRAGVGRRQHRRSRSHQTRHRRHEHARRQRRRCRRTHPRPHDLDVPLYPSARTRPRIHAGKWDKKSLQGTELRGKTLGIVGCGRIGLEVARRAKAFGMELIGYDPFIAPVIARENGITLVPIDDIFGQSDFLSLHVGLTPQTEGLINKTSIAIMKKGIRIINCARGELIVDEALAEGIKSGHVAGAALDVFRSEPLKDSPYFGLDNVLLSPHIAGSTDEAQEAIGIQLANQVRDYLKLGVVQNAVNVASLTEEEYAEVSPYIEMAARLGQLLGHAGGDAGGSVESISLTYNGRLAQLKTDMIRNAAISGVLHGADGVNRINAAAAASERGIRIQEDKREHVSGGTGATLRLAIHWSRKGASGTEQATGQVLPPFSTDIRRACSATTASTSKPNSRERWSSSATRMSPASSAASAPIIGEAQLNIANFALGRSKTNSHALAVVQLDIPAASDLEKAIADLRKVEAITSVRVVELGPL